MVAVGAQNYGQNSYRIRQPFDFAGRTGKIVFDADATVENRLIGWVSVQVTEDPVNAPTVPAPLRADRTGAGRRAGQSTIAEHRERDHLGGCGPDPGPLSWRS